MSSLGSLFRIGVAYVVSAYTGQWQIFASQLESERQRRKRDKANRRARRQFNEAQKDRLEMLDLQPDAPRTLCLGRVRYVEGVRRRWSSGVHSEILTMVVSFAGHEIDGFEQWYLDDQAVTLDGDGYVQETPYRRIDGSPTVATGTLNGSGGATIALAGAPAPGTPVFATYFRDGGKDQGPVAVSVSGSTATLSGGPAGAPVRVNYTLGVVRRFVRIRPYLGTAGQNVGAALAAEYPGKITATDRFAGIALAVVDVTYDPDVFPQGVPAVTAVFRGAHCYDPRTATTAWTENPALHALHYARWQHGWALRTQDYREADFSAAATVCEQTVGYTLTATGGGTTVVNLPRYRCGITIGSDVDHGQAMQEILDTMAGSAGWAGGVWRMRAGVMAAPVADIDASWLVRGVDESGEADDDPVIQAVQAYPRERRINIVTGRCVDPAQRYQLLPYPAVRDTVLVAAKGERPEEQDVVGCNHIAHAQHLASIAIREAQAGLRLEMRCGVQALPLELLDVVRLTLPRYGISSKPLEVVGWNWGPQQPITLRCAEISADLFTPLAVLTGRDPAPDSTLRRPWEVEALGALTVTSGTVALSDNGSILTRTQVEWPAATGENVRQGGWVEVQYTRADEDPPAGDWASVSEQGRATRAVVAGLQAGYLYLFRARAVQALPLVRGPWTQPVLHKITGVPAVGTDGLAPNAATEFYSVTPSSSVTVTQVRTTPDAYVRNTELAVVTFTPEASGTAVIYAEARGSYTEAAGVLAGPQYSIQNAAGAYDGWNEREETIPASSTRMFSMATSRRFAVTGGVTYTYGFVAAKFSAVDTFIADNIQMRVEVIKR